MTQALRQELQAMAQPFADGPKINDLLNIRRRVQQLISDIRRHKEDETILLLENVNMDIGVGDWNGQKQARNLLLAIGGDRDDCFEVPPIG